MDVLGVPTVTSSDRRTIPKDKRALVYQRACVVNMPDTLRDYDDKNQPPQLRTDIAKDAKVAKEAEKARKANEKEEKRVQKEKKRWW